MNVFISSFGFLYSVERIFYVLLFGVFRQKEDHKKTQASDSAQARVLNAFNIIGKSSASHRHSVVKSSLSHRQVIGKSSASHRQVIGKASAKHRQDIGNLSAKWTASVGFKGLRAEKREHKKSLWPSIIRRHRLKFWFSLS